MRPVDIPQGATELCSDVILQHTFGNTINDPPTLAAYTPRPSCQGDWTKVLLRWHATSRGRQFDRISAVWLSGVEVFRTCTAEPTNQGIVWVVEKDVTQFSSLFKDPQLLALELANVVDDTYTGLYNVTLSLHFYTGGKVDSTSESYGGPADAILPISEVSSLQGGYWFQLQNENDVHRRELQVPRNAYKAVLEICVSFHGDDEFWYTNPPNDFLVANNLTGAVAGNGTFREVLLSIDGLLAGVVYPFPVFYTGGVDPFFWRPVSAIGSFVVPSFHVDVTPFLGRLVDGRNHSFSFTVTNALPYWLLSANLHLWLDRSRESTQGELFEHTAPALSLSTRERYHGLDGTFATDGLRTLAYKGYLVSSFGNLTTSASYSFRFSNLLVLTEGSNASDVRQESKSESKVVVKSPVKDLVYDHSAYQFPLRLSYYQTNNPDGSVSINASIDHGWEQEQQSQSRVGPGRSSFNTLKNKQRSRGELLIPPKGAIHGAATTKQRFAYESTDGCYFRSLGVANYTFLYDQSNTHCSSFTS